MAANTFVSFVTHSNWKLCRETGLLQRLTIHVCELFGSDLPRPVSFTLWLRIVWFRLATSSLIHSLTAYCLVRLATSSLIHSLTAYCLVRLATSSLIHSLTAYCLVRLAMSSLIHSLTAYCLVQTCHVQSHSLFDCVLLILLGFLPVTALTRKICPFYYLNKCRKVCSSTGQPANDLCNIIDCF